MDLPAPVDLAGPPPPGTRVPAALRRVLGDAELRPVWLNGSGGLTFEAVGRGAFAKWAPAGSGVDLAAESTRLAWAEPYVPVPRVLETGCDEQGSWLVTATLPGRSAVDPRWKQAPEVAAAAVGTGLRMLHDTLPVDRCPFTWALEARRARARPSPEAAALSDAPPVDRLVVCHGDACAPNTLVHDDGTVAGLVDLGSLGIADRWADLAVATWSLEWNFGPGFEGVLLDAYGVAADERRTAYYRLLWHLT